MVGDISITFSLALGLAKKPVKHRCAGFDLRSSLSGDRSCLAFTRSGCTLKVAFYWYHLCPNPIPGSCSTDARKVSPWRIVNNLADAKMLKMYLMKTTWVSFIDFIHFLDLSWLCILLDLVILLELFILRVHHMKVFPLSLGLMSLYFARFKL